VWEVTAVNRNSVSPAQYCTLCELTLTHEGTSPKTLITYFSNLNRFCRFLEAKLSREPALSDLSEEAVMQYAAYLKTAGKYEKHPFFACGDEPLEARRIDQHVRILKGFAT
jgi:hypothetical protein